LGETLPSPLGRTAQWGARRRTLVVATSLLAVLSATAGHPVASEPDPEWPGLGGPEGNLALIGTGLFEPGGRVRLDLVWKRPLGAGFSAISLAGGAAATLFSDGDDEFAGAFDPDSGAERWRFRIGPHLTGMRKPGGPTSTPLIADGRVYALSPAGLLNALDLASGALLWSADLPAHHDSQVPDYMYATSPVSYDDAVIVLTGGKRGNAVTAFDAATGTTLWESGTDDISYQSPTLTGIDGRTVLLVLGDHAFTGIDPATGRTLWSQPHGGGDDESALGIHSGSIVEGPPGRFLVKNSRSGSLLFRVFQAGSGLAVEGGWQTRHLKNTYSMAVYHAGYFYGYDHVVLSCVDAATGSLVWRSREPSDGSTIVVDGHLIILSKAGRLSVAPASPDGYGEIAGIDLFAGDAWTPASLIGRSLYLRSRYEWARVDVVTEPR
jgi:outer membrane protein assembly factor BamB